MSKQHIKIVKEFNTWRRGGEMTCDEGYPKRLGEALDEVVKMAERYELEHEENNKLRMRISELEGITAFDSALQELDARGRRIDSLTKAIRQTMEENGHLADGPVCTLIHLKRAIGIQTCKKCGADMRDGVAIAQTFTGMPDFVGGDVCTVSPGGSGELIECSKCQECGWSVT